MLGAGQWSWTPEARQAPQHFSAIPFVRYSGGFTTGFDVAGQKAEEAKNKTKTNKQEAQSEHPSSVCLRAVLVFGVCSVAVTAKWLPLKVKRTKEKNAQNKPVFLSNKQTNTEM